MSAFGTEFYIVCDNSIAPMTKAMPLFVLLKQRFPRQHSAAGAMVSVSRCGASAACADSDIAHNVQPESVPFHIGLAQIFISCHAEFLNCHRRLPPCTAILHRISDRTRLWCQPLSRIACSISVCPPMAYSQHSAEHRHCTRHHTPTCRIYGTD